MLFRFTYITTKKLSKILKINLRRSWNTVGSLTKILQIEKCLNRIKKGRHFWSHFNLEMPCMSLILGLCYLLSLLFHRIKNLICFLTFCISFRIQSTTQTFLSVQPNQKEKEIYPFFQYQFYPNASQNWFFKPFINIFGFI